ncbi:MAG: 50S ribosomal protein L6 [Parcubacteria group bacterium CG10_big_fil_rev_8_21_14_0_10_38_31]|nr:MAG: 50S ribosomal protein L6 [Parcubacteria group bacterium CG10_big_fil_rev_8_21_14_0_10_38_31]
MSRLAKKPISIPDKVEVKKEGMTIIVSGPLGELRRDFKEEIAISVEEGKITLTPKEINPFLSALWGTYASHLKNMMNGVLANYEKKLIIEGVGFKVDLQGKELVLNLGFSHPVKVEVPDGVNVVVEKNNIKISGIDKEKVGAFAAKIKNLKKPEPYKGKGIRYEGEYIRRKTGKKATAGA